MSVLQTDNNYKLSAKEAKFQTEEAFTGCELVQDAHRLALMNALLHGMEGEIALGDSLSIVGQRHKNYNVILTNPPFGTKKGGGLSSEIHAVLAPSLKHSSAVTLFVGFSLKASG